MDSWLNDIIYSLKKAPELTENILTSQLSFHKEKLLNLLDAVPMTTFTHHMDLLRELIIKTENLQKQVIELEQRLIQEKK